MRLKPAILSVLRRDDLKKIVDGLDLDGVDRRSPDDMRRVLTRSRRIGADELLPNLRKSDLAAVCEVMNVPSGGTKDDLLARLMNGHGGTNGHVTQEVRFKMDDANPTTDLSVATTNGHPQGRKRTPKLTLARLESLLFKACDILRGKMDASEYKEYIFGMLFLKRLSDQFEQDMAAQRAELVSKGMRADLIEKQLTNSDKYNFYVPPEARWDKIRHLKTSVGSGLNKALEAIEDKNPNTLQDVLKGINFNRKVGQRTMEDSTLIEFIQHFDEIPLANDNFEFPDLLGAAYEYLIKFFADSAGKKGGEFYTPAEVVRLLVQIIEPQAGMTVYDPTVGSGGMLIQSKSYVEETGGSARNLGLYGQEDNGGTWAICKMNMILHGVHSSDIRQGDTLKDPQHLAPNGELRRFDRVIANPPFSQNYSKKEMKFADRFHVFMPETGKKGDLMFVQHMVSVLKSGGRMACIMPHGVLFRGGAERDCRKRFITEGWLEAVIGLPPSLFYGTGIPACVLVMNKEAASQRKAVLFINADREYREGKNQNSLRPEDIQKITHVYRNRLSVKKYSREVSHEELEREDYNLNIRRYVDNSAPPEPHDVRAHLHGGVPVAEVDALGGYFSNYGDVRDLLFQSRDEKYLDFAAGVTGKDQIRTLIEAAPGTLAKHAAFHEALGHWWSEHVGQIVELLGQRQHYEVRRQVIPSLAETLTPQNVLDGHQVRGAAASFFDFPRKVGEYVDEKGKERDVTTTIASDMKSVAASGWNPLLIPEGEILQSQFPEVLQQIEQDRARIAELEAMFAAVNGDEEDGESDDDESASDETGSSESGVLSKEQVKLLKDETKRFKSELKESRKLLREIQKDLQRLERTCGDSSRIAEQKRKADDLEQRIATTERQGAEIYEQLVKHLELESELRTLKGNIRAAERKKEELVAAARAKITDAEAKELILARFRRVFGEQFDEYLGQYRSGLVVAVENLWDKYAVTTNQILADRDREATQLHKFMKELGYE